MKKNYSEIFTENFSYKVVALIIGLILWFTILGRRDFVYTKNIDLEFRTAPGYTVVTQSVEHLRVRVSGPRASLKKFMDASQAPIPIDLTQKTEGITDVDIPYSKVEIPLGVKILSVRPNVIRLEIGTTESQKGQ